MQYEFGSEDKEDLRPEAREWRKRVNRVSELRTGGKLSMGVPLLCLFSSLLFAILYYFIDLSPVEMASSVVLPPPYLSQWEVEFPRAPDPPRCHPEWYHTVARLLSLYEYIRGMIVQSFPCLSIYRVRLMQPRRLTSKEGNTITAAHDPGPGNGQSILSARHEPQISSDNFTCTPTSIITGIHVCN